jgi:hypothetical protein
MIEILGFVLGKIADAFIRALAEKIPSETWSKLRGDPNKNAIKHALRRAIQQYATSRLRLGLVSPLLQKKSFLNQPDVAKELALIVSFEREPDAELIGRKWKASIDNPPSGCDFTREATLVNYSLELGLSHFA